MYGRCIRNEHPCRDTCPSKMFNVLKPFNVCPVALGIADRNTTDDEVAVVVLHLIHVRVTHDYFVTNDSLGSNS